MSVSPHHLDQACFNASLSFMMLEGPHISGYPIASRIGPFIWEGRIYGVGDELILHIHRGLSTFTYNQINPLRETLLREP